MLVETGMIGKLNSELSYLGGLTWHLFTNNLTITPTTLVGALVEAAWTGYSYVTGLTWSTPVIVAGAAVTTGTPLPVFGNSSGSTQTFYGWYCTDATGALVAAVNLGAQTLPNAGTYVITPSTSLSD